MLETILQNWAIQNIESIKKIETSQSGTECICMVSDFVSPVSIGRAEFIVLFHYCPYVNCWRQQGRGASDIATLCDICMEGDHALTDAFPELHLEVQTALARGDAACRLRFYQAEEREGEWQS